MSVVVRGIAFGALAYTLYRLYTSGRESEPTITMRVGDLSRNIPKRRLVEASPVYEALLQGTWQHCASEIASGKIVLEDTRANRALVYFLALENGVINANNAVDLLLATNEKLMFAANQRCLRFIVQSKHPALINQTLNYLVLCEMYPEALFCCEALLADKQRPDAETAAEKFFDTWTQVRSELSDFFVHLDGSNSVVCMGVAGRIDTVYSVLSPLKDLGFITDILFCSGYPTVQQMQRLVTEFKLRGIGDKYSRRTQEDLAAYLEQVKGLVTVKGKPVKLRAINYRPRQEDRSEQTIRLMESALPDLFSLDLGHVHFRSARASKQLRDLDLMGCTLPGLDLSQALYLFIDYFTGLTEINAPNADTVRVHDGPIQSVSCPNARHLWLQRLNSLTSVVAPKATEDLAIDDCPMLTWPNWSLPASSKQLDYAEQRNFLQHALKGLHRITFASSFRDVADKETRSPS